MEKIYLFDVDGTLTEPRQKIDEAFAEIFLKWASDKIVYLVTGSDLGKIKQQVFDELLNACTGVFCCLGNTFYKNDKLVFKKGFRPKLELTEDLEAYVEASSYPVKTGKHIEKRTGMINFSVVGRNATKEQREDYYAWDQKNHERADIVDYITKAWPKLDVAVGGMISVDIFAKGRDKSQVLKHLKKEHGSDLSIVFTGDRIYPSGNDYGLAMALEKMPNCQHLSVLGYEETRALIEYSELFR